ncbi:protease pro-enzyme activation domain-containing protein [Gryllotalpicola daejeonensis]|uniref:Protease pro-enzyme activation domain-containing protein n=1 Tax=Gryllotalpicola daejeonensis TaxID=993087 RepID=A0ABP7ZLG3_9MICO
MPSGPTGAQLPGATAFGDTPGSTPEQVTFVLRGRGIAQLQQAVLAGAVGGPQHRLSVSQFAASYGQTSRTIGALTSYLARYGIRSTVLANRLDVQTSGTASAYDRALNVSQKQYRIPGRPGRHGEKPGRTQNVHAPTRAPQLPRDLAQSVTAIFGLSNYAAFQSNVLPQTLPASGAAAAAAPGALPTKAAPVIKPATVAAAVRKTGVISEEECAEITLGLPRDCNLPQDFATQYGLTGVGRGADGTGQTVGIVTFAALDEGSPEYFWQSLSETPQRPRTVTVRNVDGGPSAVDSADSDETDLDVEQAGGVAPGANIVVYQAPNTDLGGIDALFQAAVENTAGSVSMSWANSETLVAWAQATGAAPNGWRDAFDLAFLELAAQGQSTFVASGDFGAYTSYAEPDLMTTNLSVNAFAASPFVTAAGGTTLPFSVELYGSTADVHETLAVPTERAWSSAYLWGPTSRLYELSFQDAAMAFVDGGGGGYSQTQPMPAYQRLVSGSQSFTAVRNLTSTTPKRLAPGLTLPTDWVANPTPAIVHGRATGRAIPDVSADADPETGYLVYSPLYGGIMPVGGTSIVAPQLAGAAATINQANRGRGGFWNPSIYRAAAGRTSPFTALSTTGGGNDNLFYTGTPDMRYNPATGLGTPNLAKLAAVLRR